MVVVIGIVVALVAIAGALWLLASARQREEREDVLLRLRAIGGGAGDVHVRRIKTSDIRNPLVRVLTHQFWRAGLQADPGRVRNMLLIALGVAALAAIIGGLLVAVLLVAVALLALYAFLSRRSVARRWRRRPPACGAPTAVGNRAVNPRRRRRVSPPQGTTRSYEAVLGARIQGLQSSGRPPHGTRTPPKAAPPM